MAWKEKKSKTKNQPKFHFTVLSVLATAVEPPLAFVSDPFREGWSKANPQEAQDQSGLGGAFRTMRIY